MGITCVLRATSTDQKQPPSADQHRSLRLFTPGSAPARSLHLEKAWHGIHYLLTHCDEDNAETLGFLLEGGEEIGEDLGYGPERFFSPAEVRQLNQALEGISDEQLWSHFDPEDMEAEGIYPSIWDEDEAELREEYLEYYKEVKKFVRRASEGQLGIVVLFT